MVVVRITLCGIRMLVNVTQHITGFDVARLAGVGQPTVSRALRGLPGVSAKTRAAVLQAAKDLGYLPSDSGRTLSTRVTRRVAVVSEELVNPYYAHLMESLRLSLAEHGYRTVLISDALGDDPIAEALCDGSYDAAVLTTTTRRSTLPSVLRSRRLPHVLVNRVLDDGLSPRVAIDNESGAAQAAELVASLGHTEVAILAGPAETSTGRERLLASLGTLKAHGVRVPRARQPRVPFNHDSAREAAFALLVSTNRPTAILCGNDVQAFGVLSAARDLNVSVPADLTVVGFDDIPMASWPITDLTTVHCDLRRLADAAIEVASLLVTDGPVPHLRASVMRVVPQLVKRGTHGPPR